MPDDGGYDSFPVLKFIGEPGMYAFHIPFIHDTLSKLMRAFIIVILKRKTSGVIEKLNGKSNQ